MSRDIFSFVIYIIHTCAYLWKKSPSEVYRKLQEADCISKYLVRHYDILHTQSAEYVVHDIEEYLNVRGIAI